MNEQKSILKELILLNDVGSIATINNISSYCLKNYYQLGRSFLSSGKLDAALLVFRYLALLDDSNVNYLLAMSLVLQRKNLHYEAIDILKSIDVTDQISQIKVIICLIYSFLAIGELDNAKKQFSQLSSKQYAIKDVYLKREIKNLNQFFKQHS